MRVCTASQMAKIDQITIAAGITGEELMERAGSAMTDFLLEFMDDLNSEHGSGHDCGDHSCSCKDQTDSDESQAEGNVVLICGKGNNGGDGLVMARLLVEDVNSVTVMLLAEPTELSGDALKNFDRLPPEVEVIVPQPEDWQEVASSLMEEADVVVDAIFGTGLKLPLRDQYVDLIRAINDVGLPVFAVDIASGVCGESGQVNPVAVAAEITVTVGLPKRGQLLPPGRDFTGDLEVVDIGFPEDVCEAQTAEHFWLEHANYLALIPPRYSAAHKYSCGSTLFVGGSSAYGGAAHLAGLGALRSGAGMLTMAVPDCLETVTRIALPEALIRPLPATENGTIAPVVEQIWLDLLYRQQALVLGPGLGVDSATDNWVVELLSQLTLPVVVDADALGAFSRLNKEPKFASKQVILTPHAGELARLVGLSAQEVNEQRFELVQQLAKKWQVVLMLKGSPSLIGTPDGRLFYNPSGDDALARGGSGDVLAGLIGGLLAQGADVLDAALLGAYIHGEAGTLAAESTGNRSVMVREIAAAIGPVFVNMEKEASSSAELREIIWPVC